jgi:hypothetical protein
MSVGNLKDYGNKGNNFPFQLKVLKGLSDSFANLVNIFNLLLQIKQLSAATTITRPTTSGTINTGQLSVSIANVGTANGTVKGVTLKPGETVSFSGGGIATVLDAIAYNATGTEFLIITVYPL